MAQPAGKLWRIGFVGGSSAPGAYTDAFRAGLGELGFAVGQNVSIEYRWLGDRLSPAPEVVADFVRSPVDVIVASGSHAVLSAKEATKSIPIVMVGARDPVEQGIITAYFRHYFYLDAPPDGPLTVRVRRDDGVIVYLNGLEVFRDNMPDGPVDYSTLALTPVEATIAGRPASKPSSVSRSRQEPPPSKSTGTSRSQSGMWLCSGQCTEQ